MANLLDDISQRIEVIKCYQVFIDNSVFEEESVASTYVTDQIQQFVRNELETLLGLRQKDAATNFTTQEVVALKAVAASVLNPAPKPLKVETPTLRAPPIAAAPTLPVAPVAVVPPPAPVVPVAPLPPVPTKPVPKKALRALKKKSTTPAPVNPPPTLIKDEPTGPPKRTAPLTVLGEDGKPMTIEVELSDKKQVAPDPTHYIPPPTNKGAIEAMYQQNMLKQAGYNQQILAKKSVHEGGPAAAGMLTSETMFHVSQPPAPDKD